jgi:hypothetical protein
MIVASKESLGIVLRHLLTLTNVRVSFDVSTTFSLEPVLQYTVSIALADLLAPQVLESRA